ncbi:MAG: hydroxyacid dehydrogenase [Christensenellaceae bacterium]|nr:hydroxyacid dehydrogenase [Christensenellaceae bacterium]
MKTVLLSQKLHQKALDMLEGKVNILIPEEQGQAAFDALVPQADAILLRTNVKLTAEAIKNAPNLKIVCRTGAGTDNVDKEALKEKGIILTNTPRANSISVAEHAVSLALALAKRLPVYDAETRKGGWLIRSSNTSTEITGKTVGIIGLGNIGRNAAEMFRLGFGMKVIGFDPFVKEDPNYTIVDDPAEVFRQADIISLHCPSTPETRGLVNKEMLALAKKELILVNCARGDVVVEEDLAEALREGKIAAAGLDVFHEEPIPADSPFLNLPNVIVTPHSAALTKEASVRMATQAAEQALKFLNGEQPDLIVKL